MIKLLALDIDGVLTDGRYLVMSNGIVAKSFYIRDFDAIRRIMKKAKVVLVTNGRSCGGEYAKHVGADFLFVDDSVEDKVEALKRYCKESYISVENEVAYCGDTLFDLQCLLKVPFPFIPVDADKLLINEMEKQNKSYITTVGMGTGVVSDIENWLTILKEI